MAGRMVTGDSLGSVIRHIFEAEFHSEMPERRSAPEVEARMAIRNQFLERIRPQARTEDDAIAITVAAEAWAKGTLTIFVGDDAE
jgi:hypothetical protein